jgi:hypothetical protein
MRSSMQTLIGFTLGLSMVSSVATRAFAQDEVANVLESAELDMSSGPNAGRPQLPTPPGPEPKAVEVGTTEKPADEEVNRGAVHFSAGVDFTNAYYSRGLRQEDRGFIAQPYANVGIDLIQNDSWTLQSYVGTWNSVHDRATGADSEDDSLKKWYEADLYFGLTATLEDWTIGAQYGWFYSPNDAFTTVEELQFTLTYNHEDWLKLPLLKGLLQNPTLTVVIETGDGTSDGIKKGIYGQLSFEPGHDFDLGDDWTLRASAPLVVGFSIKDYYQDENGDDEFFGYFSVGGKLALELPINPKYGDWSAYVGANLVVLGDYASTTNDDEDTAWVFTSGFSMSY